jgi:hypothetical protein
MARSPARRVDRSVHALCIPEGPAYDNGFRAQLSQFQFDRVVLRNGRSIDTRPDFRLLDDLIHPSRQSNARVLIDNYISLTPRSISIETPLADVSDLAHVTVRR